VSFTARILRVASQRVFIIVVYFVMTHSGNFWIHLVGEDMDCNVARMIVHELWIED
jgi:hypothetical protein